MEKEIFHDTGPTCTYIIAANNLAQELITTINITIVSSCYNALRNLRDLDLMSVVEF